MLDPSKEEVYAFLDKFFGEMAGLFPDAFMHIGGDEVTPRQWNASAPVQDFIYRQGLDGAHGIQAYFNKRVNEIFTRHGKRMVGWDEILSPDLPKNIVVHSWRGQKALAEAAKQGYEGILSNGYYLDLLFPVADHYLNDPIPADSTLTADERRRILGGEACMWSEFVTPETIDSRIWPRMAAIAERLWSPAEVRDLPDMYRRLEVESVRLGALGMRHLSSYEPMLKRITGGQPTESLRVLADLVTPVKGYRRGQLARLHLGHAAGAAGRRRAPGQRGHAHVPDGGRSVPAEPGGEPQRFSRAARHLHDLARQPCRPGADPHRVRARAGGAGRSRATLRPWYRSASRLSTPSAAGRRRRQTGRLGPARSCRRPRPRERSSSSPSCRAWPSWSWPPPSSISSRR